MMYFESHAHYDDELYDIDRDQLLRSLAGHGVDYVVNAGAGMKTSLYGIGLSEKYDFMYAAVGVHPHEAESMTDEDLETLRKCLAHPKVVALGEIGLDYFYDHSPRDKQVYWFKKQLELAAESGMPFIIHSRDADEQVRQIIAESGLSNGVIHCFSSDVGLAEEYVKQGFYIGIGGIITFKNSAKLVEVVERVSLDKILIETDCPYLSPVPYRGQRNDSTRLVHIVERIAQIKGVTPKEVADTTMQNGLSFYNISKSYQ